MPDGGGQISVFAIEIEARRQAVLRMVTAGRARKDVAVTLGISISTVTLDLAEMRRRGHEIPDGRKAAGSVAGSRYPSGRKRRTDIPEGVDRAAFIRDERVGKAVLKVRDRRRFKSTPVPTGEAARLAPQGLDRTMFPKTVADPTSAEPVLKDGSSNSKIGGDVLVGWLKGAHIVTLTLEERETCPKSCELYRRCYGNSMQWSRRWRHGQELEACIAAEVEALCRRHDRVLVRLHVLGDWYSTGYVAFWGSLLACYPGLHVFGFTAWAPNTEIGAAVAALREQRPRQFWMRHSGTLGPWGSATLDFPTERKTVGDGIVCPEQRSAMGDLKDGRHCGSCGACWSTDRTVFFVEH